MLYMKEMRPIVQAECTLKESAAINQILGRRVSFFSLFMSIVLFLLVAYNKDFLFCIDNLSKTFSDLQMENDEKI